MAYELNKKIRDLKPYDPIQGNYRVRLDANESFYNIPDSIKQKALERIAGLAFNRYPDPMARNVCEKFASYYQVDPTLVTACNGSDESIFVIMSAFLMRGDKVITLSDDFSMYRFYASLSEAELIELPKRADLTIDVDQLIEKSNAENASMIIFSNPCNPTSLGLEREEVLRLIRSVNALVVLDEAYMDFWDQSLLDCVNDYDNLIILRTCSKAFGMASIRLGFSVANRTLTDAIKAVKSPYNSNVITQEIGAIVYENGDLMRETTQNIIASRKNLYAGLQKLLKIYPEAFMLYKSCTNFVYMKTDYAAEIYAYLLENSIAIRSFNNGFLRITAGSAKENRALINTLTTFLENKGKGASK